MNENDQNKEKVEISDLPNLDSYSADSNPSESNTPKSKSSSTSEEQPQSEPENSPKETSTPIEPHNDFSKIPISQSMTFNQPEPEEVDIGGYSSVKGISSRNMDLFNFENLDKKRVRKYSHAPGMDFGKSSEYSNDDVNYMALRRDISQRRMFSEEMEIKVGDPEKKTGDNFLYFHAYRVSVVKEGKEVWRVYRRYTDFDWLNKFLEFKFPGKVLPVLPPKNALTKINLNSDEFLGQRVKLLRRYVKRLQLSRELLVSEPVFHFLFSRKKDYALYLQNEKSELIDLEETSIVSKVTDFMSFMFSKPK
jgi:hypothetical protein